MARIHIAICDDEKNIRAYIRRLIESRSRDDKITEYPSGEELLAQIKDTSRQDIGIDLLFLDIAMKGTDGMAIAKQLREAQAARGQAVWGSFPLIVFVTGFSEYMPAAFSVNAFQFLVKPIKEAEFERVFRQAQRECRHMAEQRNKAEKHITIGSGSTMQDIKAGDILYIESGNHKIRIHLQNMCMEHYGKISDLERELAPEFFRIHRGYLINLAHIDHYDRTDVYMDNGDRLLLSRYKYQDFTKAYLRHISEDRE